MYALEQRRGGRGYLECGGPRNSCTYWSKTTRTMAFVGIYTKPNKIDKLRLFDQLESLSSQLRIPWLVQGDFNKIGYAHEKRGGRTTIITRLLSCQNHMARCEHQDLGFYGPQYTWTNRRKEGRRIRERMDRAMANDLWVDKYPEYAVIHLPPTHSDHHPIMTNCFCLDRPIENKPFRFEVVFSRRV